MCYSSIVTIENVILFSLDVFAYCMEFLKYSIIQGMYYFFCEIALFWYVYMNMNNDFAQLWKIIKWLKTCTVATPLKAMCIPW